MRGAWPAGGANCNRWSRTQLNRMRQTVRWIGTTNDTGSIWANGHHVAGERTIGTYTYADATGTNTLGAIPAASLPVGNAGSFRLVK